MEVINFIAFISSKIRTNREIKKTLEKENEEYKKNGTDKNIIEINEKEITNLSNEEVVLGFIGNYIVELSERYGDEMDLATEQFQSLVKEFTNLMKEHNANTDTIEC